MPGDTCSVAGRTVTEIEIDEVRAKRILSASQILPLSMENIALVVSQLLVLLKRKYSSAGTGLWPLTFFKVCSGLAVLATLLYGLLWYGQNYDREMPGKYYDSARDYQKIPFDMTDATTICKQKTLARYGKDLVRSYVDEHSTRYEANIATYKIFMHAHLGTKTLYSEASVHCFVDPFEYMVSHYRIYEPKRDSLMNRALNFFAG